MFDQDSAQPNRFLKLRRALQTIGSLGLCLCLNLVLSLAVSLSATAASLPEITVYRDPGCRCCEGWVEHLTQQGFPTQVTATADMDSVKQRLGVPTEMGSCHTAIVNGYLLEGHVPVAEIQRLLTERPDITGIAVPGMPVGTPGMEDGDRHDPFDVVSFGPKTNQTAVFQHHEF